MTNHTDFGYQEVEVSEKAKLVSKVFTSVASKYDLMNDLMSMGIHRLWKRYTIDTANVRAGQHILDIAGGTGDLTSAFAQRVGKNGRVILADINSAMLKVGRDRLIDENRFYNIDVVQANAECLPFPDNYFDLISIAFGLRNVTDKQQALQSMMRCLKPGGRLLILEFSQVTLSPLKWIYDQYSFSVLPLLGKFIANDEASYRYLAESIRMHPDQETLKTMLLTAGFDECQYHNFSAGVVALHIGYKY
ncbi:MAG: bifunctional demethylmenaquinone methyltransferase/2-methoxy-6-polyprenyl-1,4-benzoquinol methylase UbiE [Legionellales bacterium]|nr:bifunctional demethylmenaquinone methyltransferase/2-methoxy-6-polyprenyl-1,4-benzoquinol methylase UbiE [Legionellales bacterium]